MDSIRRTGARAAAWWSARSPTLHWSVGGAALGVVLGLVIAIGVTALSGDGGSDAPIDVKQAVDEGASDRARGRRSV